MKTKDHIIKKLNELVRLFPSIKVSYEIDENSNSHYVKVLPLKEFDTNDEYHKFETNFILSFIEQFPYEEIVFVSENSLIEVLNPIFEIEGNLFRKNILAWNDDIWSNNLKTDSNLTFNKSLEEIF